MLTTAPLNELRGGTELAEHLDAEQIPPSAVVELISLLPFINDDETRYRLLAGETGLDRARVLDRELKHLSDPAVAPPSRRSMSKRLRGVIGTDDQRLFILPHHSQHCVRV